MSRTIKTRPLFVRVMDPKDHTVGVRETHHHEKGYCDLPPRTIEAVMERYELIRNGTYEVSRSETCIYDFSYVGTNICGCALCTGQFERKEKARKDRRTTKVTLTQETKRLRAVNDLDEVLEDIETPL